MTLLKRKFFNDLIFPDFSATNKNKKKQHKAKKRKFDLKFSFFFNTQPNEIINLLVMIMKLIKLWWWSNLKIKYFIENGKWHNVKVKKKNKMSRKLISFKVKLIGLLFINHSCGKFFELEKKNRFVYSLWFI